MSKKTTKRALAMSFVSVFLCVCMLVGTTFAWFTDSATSENNIIKSGKLDVEMLWKDAVAGNGTQDTYKDASTGAIFSYDLWEPGFVDAKNIQIKNIGTLALKYKLNIVPSVAPAAGEANLADVIDVYFANGTVASDRNLTGLTKVGTLSALMADPDGAAYGNLDAGTSTEVTIALKMQESADNKYQQLSVGDGFKVQLLATQKEAEFDSFDNTYDKFADYDGEISTATALAAALAKGGTYKVVSDIAVSESMTIPAGVAVNLDLNGKEIKGIVGRDADGNRVHTLVNNGTLTLVGGTVASAGVNGGSAIYNADGATLTVENVTLNGAPQEGSTWPSYTVNNYGTLTVSDSSINGVQGIIATNNTANTTVNNVIAYRDGWSSGHVFYTSSTAKVTINGGTYTNDGNGVDGTMIYGGETVVNGGTFIVQEGAYFALTGNSNLVVNGGDFSNIKSCLAWGGAMTISGGTFGFDPTAYVATGYKAVENNGVYLVLPANVVAVVSDTGELTDAIKNAPTATTDNIIYLTDGTYSGDINITVAAMGQGGDVVIKAMDGTNPVIAGTVTLGYRNQGVGATMYNANVTFEGITFDHAEAAKHSLEIQDVKSLTLKNCTIIGDGEYGIGCARGNGTGTSKIVGCTFENAGMQLLGNFATGLVIDQCTFNESCINVQAGNGVTVQNCEFNNTLTSANVGESFYLVRSNSTPITVKNCEINIDSELTDVATGQAKWGVMWNRGSTNWTVENVAVTTTSAAQAQTELLITKCTSTGVINTANLTVNGVAQ